MKPVAKPAEKKPAPVAKPVAAPAKPVAAAAQPAVGNQKLEKITFNGVQYEISTADLEQLQTILSRARVVTDDKAPQVKPVADNSAIITRRKLMDDVVAKLVGHTNVVYFDYKINSLNTNTYNGYEIIGDPKHNKELKDAIEQSSQRFKQQYEIEAFVTMTVHTNNLFGVRLIAKPQYASNGDGVVGNMVVKNKATGEYELYGARWTERYCGAKTAAEMGNSYLALYLSLASYMKLFLSAHMR